MPEPDPRRADGAALRRVVAQAAATAGCVAAGLTLLDGGDLAVLVASSPLAERMEEAQWAARQGPGPDAVGHLQVFNVGSPRAARSWPRFADAAERDGIRSCLAVPIISGGRALGSLVLYAAEDGAFEGVEQVALHHAHLAAQAVAGLQPAAASPAAS